MKVLEGHRNLQNLRYQDSNDARSWQEIDKYQTQFDIDGLILG